MHRRIYSLGTVERKAGRPMTIVAANEGRQADGIDLRMENADLARYLANPVLGYGHSYWGRDELPIGRATSTTVEGAQLLIVPEFDKDDEFAQVVERKLRSGYLNAVSVGFDAHDVDDLGVPGRWELFEVSVVPLPMDAGALVASRGHGCPRCAHLTAAPDTTVEPAPPAEPSRNHAADRRSQLIRADARVLLGGSR